MADDKQQGDGTSELGGRSTSLSVAPSIQYWLEYRGSAIEMRGGQLLVGRSAMCRLVLDDPLVSRQHAELRQSGDSVFLFDLKSVNGVFVNGRRVEQKVELRPGDKIVIGEQEMTLVARSYDTETKPHVPSLRRLSETLHQEGGNTGRPPQADDMVTDDYAAVVDGAGLDDARAATREEQTFQGEALELLTGVADKVLAMGRGEEAERILGTYMANLLEAARGGASVSPRTADKAAAYAVKLASVTGKGGWVDYAITLFGLMRRPLPGPVVDELYEVLRRVPGVSLSSVREYVSILHGVQTRFGPAERFLLQRIEGLERLAALR